MAKQKINTEDPNNIRATAPLLCWDIFMDSYWQKMQLIDDADRIDDIAKKFNWKHNWDFKNKILQENKVVVVTTASLKIITASTNISAMTGYSLHEITGNAPSMFQGAATEENSKKIIRKAIKELQSFDITLINYRKDGSTYACHVEAHPVFNNKKQLSHFIAFENEAA